MSPTSRCMLTVLCLTILAGGLCGAQEEPPDAKQLITTYASTIVPFRLEDQMRDLAENRREEGLQAFEGILEHADEYPDHVVIQQVLGAMVEHFGDEEPRRIFTEWVLTTDSERFAKELRYGAVTGPPFHQPEWLRGLYEHAAEHAESERIRYVLIRLRRIELTGDELEAYLQSDEGLYASIRAAGSRSDRGLAAMEKVLAYHGEHYAIYHLHRALLLWSLDRGPDALADLDAYIDLHPEAPYPHHLRARVLAEMGDAEGARAAAETYQAKTEAVEPLEIELPDLPDELPETDLHFTEIPRLTEEPDPADVPRLARAVASSNGDYYARVHSLRALEECFADEELLPAVPWLDLAVKRRLLRIPALEDAARLLGRIGQPSSAAVVADLAVDEMWPATLRPTLVRALSLFPTAVAKHHLLWLMLQTHDRTCLGYAQGLYGPEQEYWRVHWELIAGATPEERIGAAALKRDLLGSLTLYEMATDQDLDAAMRAEAAQALRAQPRHPLADLVGQAEE